MNGSTVTEFVFLDFSGSRTAQLFLLTLVITCYTTVLVGNLLIIVTVQSEPKLFQSPMYFFLANLSLLDISMGSVAAPKLATELVNKGGTISFAGCMAQIMTCHFFGGGEMFLLSVMAYDRYMAICHPLRYATIMNRQCCFRLIIFCWTGGFIHGSFNAVVLSQQPYCGPNVLDHFFCDIPQVMKLSCSETYIVEILMLISDGVVTLPCFLSLLVSYVIILATLCGHFGKGGIKALSTCGSHLMVVGLYYGPIGFVYFKPASGNQVDKMAAVFYMVVTPALNPLIYTLRNKEVKGAMGKLKNKANLSISCCLNRSRSLELPFPAK
ncbi:olfactory receptor 4Q3-like [Tiliqua scincoides]|uniref:olfactory receptor 4Q3-like n=1 Tax=Tiliqua scincoides TaxID=71010 RepID=UPI003461DB61